MIFNDSIDLMIFMDFKRLFSDYGQFMRNSTQLKFFINYRCCVTLLLVVLFYK